MSLDLKSSGEMAVATLTNRVLGPGHPGRFPPGGTPRLMECERAPAVEDKVGASQRTSMGMGPGAYFSAASDTQTISWSLRA